MIAPNRMAKGRYYNATSAAEALGCSRSSVCKAAKNHSIGIFANGRLAALTSDDLNSLKAYIHERAGNPLWVAKTKKKSKRTK